MTDRSLDRRRFLRHTSAALGGISAGVLAGCDEKPEPEPPVRARPKPEPADPLPDRKPYAGPNVILVRFGGGVRRRETIEFPEKTWCPFITHELLKPRGRDDAWGSALFANADIASAPGVETSHGQGTLYILTGQYDHYEDISHKPFSDRFEARIPTLFEYFRRHYDVPEHQALIINGEDRINEEFYTFSNHHLYGVRYRSTVLSLYRFKTYLLREELKARDLPDKLRVEKEKKLREMERKDYRVQDARVVGPELNAFWEGWKGYYGTTGLVNPRGDRVLTALALRALKELRPKLLMINYQDPDYVHWGNPNFYTRAISIIDEGVREIFNAVRDDPGYRDNTVFVIVPDCGRDSNRGMAVPFQHHFNSRSAHDVFIGLAGPRAFGVPQLAKPSDRPEQQIAVTATVGKLMGFPTHHVDADSLL